jgi:hypothetical protein
MKKTINLFLIISVICVNLATSTTFAEDEIQFHKYTGYSTNYEFSVNYPTDWKAQTYGDDMQGFLPDGLEEDPYFTIKEFEGYTYDQVIQFYSEESLILSETQDIIFPGGSDLVAKKVVFKDTSSGEFKEKTLIKRGGLIVVLSANNSDEAYGEKIEFIHDSFQFSDQWHQYIDLNNGYTFIFPSALDLNNLSDGVTVTDSGKEDKIIFSVYSYPAISLDDAPKEAEGYSEDLIDTESTLFHGIENAITATYKNNEEKKTFQSIFVNKNETTYEISDINIESNFPRMDYYNQYVAEMVESFEFFQIDSSKSSFQFFPDITASHNNKQSINYLATKGIIAGYPDGTFKPDGEINRAELTKMIVAARENPDANVYKNCFPDVKEDWYAPYVCYAKEKNYVQGYADGTFKPEQKINRVEAIKIVLEVIFGSIEEEIEGEMPVDVNTDDWYGKYFIFAENRDLLDKQHAVVYQAGYSYFPDQNISRKEVAEIIYRSMVKYALTFL